ncbi:hypothetical protein JL721_11652 [Aureococcus anophagefferens]|nr:hypothetical protein JL721_11652 [Aureococcus anophagefferens]
MTPQRRCSPLKKHPFGEPRRTSFVSAADVSAAAAMVTDDRNAALRAAAEDEDGTLAVSPPEPLSATQQQAPSQHTAPDEGRVVAAQLQSAFKRRRRAVGGDDAGGTQIEAPPPPAAEEEDDDDESSSGGGGTQIDSVARQQPARPAPPPPADEAPAPAPEGAPMLPDVADDLYSDDDLSQLSKAPGASPDDLSQRRGAVRGVGGGPARLVAVDGDDLDVDALADAVADAGRGESAGSVDLQRRAVVAFLRRRFPRSRPCRRCSSRCPRGRRGGRAPASLWLVPAAALGDAVATVDCALLEYAGPRARLTLRLTVAFLGAAAYATASVPPRLDDDDDERERALEAISLVGDKCRYHVPPEAPAEVDSQMTQLTEGDAELPLVESPAPAEAAQHASVSSLESPAEPARREESLDEPARREESLDAAGAIADLRSEASPAAPPPKPAPTRTAWLASRAPPPDAPGDRAARKRSFDYDDDDEVDDVPEEDDDEEEDDDDDDSGAESPAAPRRAASSEPEAVQWLKRRGAAGSGSGFELPRRRRVVVRRRRRRRGDGAECRGKRAAAPARRDGGGRLRATPTRPRRPRAARRRAPRRPRPRRGPRQRPKKRRRRSAAKAPPPEPSSSEEEEEEQEEQEEESEAPAPRPAKKRKAPPPPASSSSSDEEDDDEEPVASAAAFDAAAAALTRAHAASADALTGAKGRLDAAEQLLKRALRTAPAAEAEAPAKRRRRRREAAEQAPVVAESSSESDEPLEALKKTRKQKPAARRAVEEDESPEAAWEPTQYEEAPVRNQSVLWSALKGRGWTWKRGSGLVDFYYLRPGHEGAKLADLVEGEDYFEREALWAVADREKLWPTETVATKRRRGDEPAPARKKAAEPSSSKKRRPSAEPRDAPAMSSASAAWRKLWPRLERDGWTYRWAPQHLERLTSSSTLYVKPGARDFVLGVNAFATEADVQAHLDEPVLSLDDIVAEAEAFFPDFAAKVRSGGLDLDAAAAERVLKQKQKHIHDRGSKRDAPRPAERCSSRRS